MPRGHTNKHKTWEKTLLIYHAVVYTSGKRLHTAEITCTTNGRVERKSFSSPLCNNRNAAIQWCEDFLTRQISFREGYG